MQRAVLRVAAFLGLVVAFPADAPSQQGWTANEPPSIGMVLVGTATSETGGLAILQLTDGRVQVVEPGSQTQGYTVMAIEAARVVLKNVDGEIALELRGADPRGGPDARLAAARRELVNTVSFFLDDVGGGNARQEGDVILITGPTGLLEVSIRLPAELAGERIDLPR